MATVKYTVQKGDTLSKIAAAYNTTVAKLVELNKLVDPNHIVVGQVLVISGSAVSVSTSSKKANITVFGLQSNTTSTVYAAWAWTRRDTENYRVQWYYDTGDGVWFIGTDTTVNGKQSTYAAPDNATRVRFRIIPLAKTRTVNGKESVYWTADWSSDKTYAFVDNPPTTPPVPTVEIEDYMLIATLDNLDVNATSIQFKVVKNDTDTYKISNSTIRTATNSVRYSCAVVAGDKYKVTCRAARGDLYSDWSDFSDEVETKPSASSGITVCRASSKTSVYLEWNAVATAKTYDVQYTTKREYFEGSNQLSTETGIESNHYEITGLEIGHEYFFRVRAVNEQGESAWSGIKSVVLGRTPAAPTTWSSSTTAMVGEDVVLYWAHNSIDGSTQAFAEVNIIINGIERNYILDTRGEEDDELRTSYTISTDGYEEGTTISWKVRTAGVTEEYSDWSIIRTINVYAPPSASVTVLDLDSKECEVLPCYPFYIRCEAGPTTQSVVGYHIAIVANEGYETYDSFGNFKMVNAGDEVYSKYYTPNSHTLNIMLSADSVELANNITYMVVATVTMSSGLVADGGIEFTVGWKDTSEMYEPNAEVSVDMDRLITSIRPYCEDDDGNTIENVKLSVYRREFDGGFTELVPEFISKAGIFTFFTDPHPALDYARYRVVAKSTTTGEVTYNDIPGIPVGETSIVLQWDESWSSFNSVAEDRLANSIWAGMMLKLPYNIDISDNNNPDVSLIEYIGREHPVSYYGTQLGTSATWNAEIPKSDVETLYSLRRLARWMGDVYVREPSGSGYWANVTVSFNISHLDLTIPVTLNVKRVAGGA